MGFEAQIEAISESGDAADGVAEAVRQVKPAAVVPDSPAGMKGAKAVAKLARVKESTGRAQVPSCPVRSTSTRRIWRLPRSGIGSRMRRLGPTWVTAAEAGGPSDGHLERRQAVERQRAR